MRGGAAPLARIVPSSSFVCDDLLRARRPALTGPSGGGLGIASVRSLYGQPAAGYLRFAPVARPQGSLKNDTSGVEPVERPSHRPPRGTRGDPLGLSSPPPWVVNRSLQGGESEPPGTRAGASGCQAGPSSILVAAESRLFAASRLRTTTPKIPRRSPELLSTTPEHRRTSSKLRHRTLKHRHTCP